jgi:hypothetical protein
LVSEDEPIQHLPLAGLYVYPEGLGPFLVGLQTEAGRFYQKDGIEVYRIEVLPYLYHSAGSYLKLQQSVEPFLAHYSLKDGKEEEKDSYGLTYRAALSSTFYSRGHRLIHTITPEVAYEYRTRKHMPGYVFDEQETDSDLSRLISSILQRFYLDGSHLGAVRLSHIYDFRRDNASQFVLEGYKTGRLSMKFDVYYDVDTSDVKKYHYRIGLNLERFSVSAGESYSIEPKIRNYQGNLTIKPIKWLVLHGGLWYDQRQDEFTKITYGGKIEGQCASLSVTYSKTQTQYSIFVLLTFKGLGEVKYGELL